MKKVLFVTTLVLSLMLSSVCAFAKPGDYDSATTWTYPVSSNNYPDLNKEYYVSLTCYNLNSYDVKYEADIECKATYNDAIDYSVYISSNCYLYYDNGTLAAQHTNSTGYGFNDPIASSSLTPTFYGWATGSATFTKAGYKTFSTSLETDIVNSFI